MKKLIVLLITSCGMAALASAQNFTLKSNEIGGQATMREVFNGFGCSGENVSPQLSWSDAPDGTKSFAITMYDPDAPTGSGLWHWVMYDIPAGVMQLPAGAGTPANNTAPKGSVHGITDFGKPGYGGPCPPEGHGYHRYIITVYALKTEKLGLDAGSPPALVGYNINSNTLAKASLIMYYQR